MPERREHRRGLPPLFRRLAWVNLLVLLPALAVCSTLAVLAGRWPLLALALPLVLAVGDIALLAGGRKPAPGSAVAEVPRWTPRLTDPAPDQCPVCGMGDLEWWREVDVFTLREGDERHVQPYGLYHAAHRFCAELVPYAAAPGRSGPATG